MNSKNSKIMRDDYKTKINHYLNMQKYALYTFDIL